MAGLPVQLMDSYAPLSQTEISSPQQQESDSLALDHLLHSKSRILRGKLEVLASEIYARLTMWNRNLARIDDDKAKVEEILNQFTRLARYRLREQQEVTRLRDS